MPKRLVMLVMVLCLLAAVPAGAAPVEREGEGWSLAGVWERVVAWVMGGEVEPEPAPPPVPQTNGGPGGGDEDGGPGSDPDG